MIANLSDNLRAASGAERLKASIRADSTELVIWLTGEVGNPEDESDAASIAKFLAKHPTKPVRLRVNSGGGAAFDGVAIHNALADHAGPTTGVIEGIAASAAAIAVTGCDVVQMHHNSTFMIHECLCIAAGHAWEIREILQWMDELDEAMSQTLADRSGQSIETVRKQLRGSGDGTTFTAQEAVAHGYADEILQPKRNRRRSRSAANRMRQELMNLELEQFENELAKMNPADRRRVDATQAALRADAKRYPLSAKARR